MQEFNPTFIYRRSLEEDNNDMRQQIVSLKYHIEIAHRQTGELQSEIRRLKAETLELEFDARKSRKYIDRLERVL